MDPQTLLSIRAVVIFAAGIFASRGLISQDTATWLGSPETMAALAALVAFGTTAWGVWLNRPHKRIADVAALPQVDTVVVKPKTAAEMQVANVVSVAPPGVSPVP